MLIRTYFTLFLVLAHVGAYYIYYIISSKYRFVNRKGLILYRRSLLFGARLDTRICYVYNIIVSKFKKGSV